MFSRETVGTLFFLAVGVVITLSSWGLGFGKWEDPGPGFMGTLSGAALALFSAVWLIYSWAKDPRTSTSPPTRFFSEAYSLRRIVKVLLSLCAFTLLLGHLGFLICTLLFMSFLFKEDARGWPRTLLYSFVTSIATFLIFELWLQVQFPEGLLPTYRIKQWIF